MLRLAPLLLLLACTKQDEDTEFTLGLVTSDVDIPSCDTTDTGVVDDESLTVSQVAPETIALSHTGYRAQCCAQFEVRGVVLTGDSTVRVDYQDNGQPCDCMCRYDLDYVLSPVPNGTYQVNAQGAFAEIRVQ